MFFSLRLVEKGEELVVFLLRKRIVLVVVALGAGHGQTQKDGGGGVGPVHDLLDPELLLVDSPLAVGEGIAVKPGRHALFGARIRQQVPGHLLDDEPVVGGGPD